MKISKFKKKKSMMDKNCYCQTMAPKCNCYGTPCASIYYFFMDVIIASGVNFNQLLHRY